MSQYYNIDFKKVEDITDREIIIVTQSQSIMEVLETILKNNKSDVLLVKEIKEDSIYDYISIITIKEIGNILKQGIDLKDKIGNHFRNHIEIINSHKNISTAKAIMEEKGVDRLLVVKDKKFLGIIRFLDIIKHQYLIKNEIELQLRLILGNLYEAVCVINTSGIVTFWNKSSEKLYDLKEEQIVGHHIEEFFPDPLLLKVLKDKKTYQNFKHRPKDKSHVIISAKPLIYKGEIIGAVSTDRDLNEITNLYMELDREKTKVEILKQQMKEITQDRYYFGKIIGKSKALIDAMTIAKQVAKTDASVLITGESGTGKEVFSRAIHEESQRKGDFIPVNCSAIPANLLESELFGYVEGAFTGAYKKGRPGKFELANGGTLFLDEIGDMPLIMQAKLLRVLQDGIVYRIGSGKPIKVDSRIIAATNKNIKDLMDNGEFREDLYYILNVVSIRIPPLRERKEDIPELIKDFIQEFAEKNNKEEMIISTEAMKILSDYQWRGNIRELKNTMERLVILSKNNNIMVEDIPLEIINDVSLNSIINFKKYEEFNLKKAVEEFEKNMIKEALIKVQGNRTKAAKVLNIKRSTLYYKLDLYELNDFQINQ